MSQQSQKSRKIRAIAAGGAVLGVGAAITLAAWSDSEFAQGIFNSGTFGIEASADGGATWTENPDPDSPLTLNFDAEAMAPGETVTAAYQIRNIDGGADSEVTFLNGTSTGELTEHLTVRVLQVESASCESVTGNEPVLTEDSAFTLTGQDTENLCIQVTLDGEEFSSPTPVEGALVWQFQAEQAV